LFAAGGWPKKGQPPVAFSGSRREEIDLRKIAPENGRFLLRLRLTL
jgi:hypothetical protein